MAENLPVCQGDTLVVLNAGSIDEQIRLNVQRIGEYQSFIADINALLREEKRLATPKYRIEWQYSLRQNTCNKKMPVCRPWDK
jgi:argonaute-like protein implicated in RNA metabolism and viral defense